MAVCRAAAYNSVCIESFDYRSGILTFVIMKVAVSEEKKNVTNTRMKIRVNFNTLLKKFM